jgi:hypothetical protein
MPSKRAAPAARSSTPPTSTSSRPKAIAPADPTEVQRRGLWHDVRSLLAAATTNAEYMATLPDMPTEAVEVAREVQNELRLATDIIALVSSMRDPDALVELDFRAVIWLGRRTGHRILVDATVAPFVVRGRHASILALADAALESVVPGKPARLDIDGDSLLVVGLDPVRVRAIADRPDEGLSVQVQVRGDVLALTPR